MMKKIPLIALVMVFAVACTSSNTEKRLQDLEKRVSELEGQRGPLSKRLKSNNIESVDSSTPQEVSSIKFEEMEYNFGTINEGDFVEHVFAFENTGDKPLVIQKATASCGCTVPSWPKEPIAPGEKGVIKVKFNSKGKPNKQTKRITITANTNPPVTRLTLKGMVTPAS